MGSNKRGKKPSKPLQAKASDANKAQLVRDAPPVTAKVSSRKAITGEPRTQPLDEVGLKPSATKATEGKAPEHVQAAENPITEKVTAAIADLAAAAKAEIKVQPARGAERFQPVKLIAPKGVEGAKVSEKFNGEKVFESFTKLGESFFSVDGVKKAAAWYIETSEKLAHQAIELGEKGTSWAKETPLAPLFEAQTSMAKKFIERSASAARNLWQISHHAA